jgi:hypothetical protein
MLTLPAVIYRQSAGLDRFAKGRILCVSDKAHPAGERRGRELKGWDYFGTDL